MEEPNSPVIHPPLHKNNPPPKSLSSFLYKSILFSIIIALLPLFPPQTTPESNNPTFLSRTWELLHLLLVGIAVSYGLFSRRNAYPDIDKDKEKDTSFNPRFLHISPLLEDEDIKIETWSSQHHCIETKPLLLPIRSLKKSQVHNSDSSVFSSPSSSFYAKSLPPPPPPPPPCFSHGSLISTRREVRKSFKDELKDLSIKGREGFLKNSSAQAETKKEKKKKKKVEFLEKMIVMSDDSESEKASDSSDAERHLNWSGVELQDNEVDKKADEFIAKFREQIRLQRIESIKKSSGHRAVKIAK